VVPRAASMAAVVTTVVAGSMAAVVASTVGVVAASTVVEVMAVVDTGNPESGHAR
jgi:hypothetical protein